MGKRRNTTRKALRMESLEARQLMAADIGLHHGILNVRGTHQDDVIKMDQVQVGRASKAYQGTSIIKVSVANKQGKVLKATSTAAARKMHEASIADSNSVKVKGRDQAGSSQGRAKEKTTRHFPRTYRQAGVSFDQLKKLRSVKPIHQKQQDSNSSSVEATLEADLKAKGWTKENLYAQNAAEELQLSEENTDKLHQYVKETNDFDLDELRLTAAALHLNTTPEDAKDADVNTMEELMCAKEKHRVLGINKPFCEILEGAKENKGDKESEKAVDRELNRMLRAQNGLAPDDEISIEGTLNELAEGDYGLPPKKDGYSGENDIVGGGATDPRNDGDSLDSLENTEPPQKPSASEGAFSLGDEEPLGSGENAGMGSLTQYYDGAFGVEQDSTGSGSGSSTNNYSNSSSTSSDDGGSGDGGGDGGGGDGTNQNPTGDDSTPVTGSQNDSKPKSESESQTGTGNGKDDSGDNASGGNESGSHSSARTTTVLGKSENGNTTTYTWMCTTKSDTGGAVFGETTYTQQEDGTYREEVSYFGAKSGKAVKNVSRKFEGNSGDSTNSDDGDHAYFGVNITGRGDGGKMNPWKKKRAKPRQPSPRNPGDIDPINPNYADAVFARGDGSAEKWAREGLGNKKRKAQSAPQTRPADNPNDERDGHTCPDSGDADRNE